MKQDWGQKGATPNRHKVGLSGNMLSVVERRLLPDRSFCKIMLAVASDYSLNIFGTLLYVLVCLSVDKCGRDN